MAGGAAPQYDGIIVQGTNNKGVGRGRSLHSARDFAPGDLVAIFREPLVAFPDAAHASTTCHHCLAQNIKVVGCTGCNRAVKYCGSACQRANWKLVHSKECKVFLKVKAAVGKDWLPTPVRSLVQLLLRWPEVQPLVDGLEGNVDKFKARKALWEDMKLQAYAGIHYSGRREDDDNLHMALDVLCKIQTNSFDRRDADTGQSGTFLDPMLAMMNHSCLPNAVVVFSGRSAYVRAESAIKKGEEITISYTDYAQPLDSRRKELDLYHFTCACGRCSDHLNVYQVCQTSPLVGLNFTSISPGVERLKSPPVDINLLTQPAWRSQIDDIYAACAHRGRRQEVTSVSDRLEKLKADWARCAPLITAKAWGMEPLAHTIQLATLYYLAADKLASGLATACFSALHCDPYQHVAPFKQSRLTGLMLIAKILAQFSLPGCEELYSKADRRVMAVMGQFDQASLLQALLLLVIKLGPMGHSEEWPVLEEAKAMLTGLEAVPGRQKEAALVQNWAAGILSDGSTTASRVFFERKVLGPMEELAEVAMDLLQSDLAA